MNVKVITILMAFILIAIPINTTYFKEKMNENAHVSFAINGRILYVGGGGDGNYSSIQDAINDASDGDTVFVYDDSSPYYENIVINKSINLIGEAKDTTIIDGTKNGSVITLLANECLIEKFTITGRGENPKDAGIKISSDSNTIKNNIISGKGLIGLYLQNSSYNNISFNSVTFFNYCVRLENACNNTFFKNRISSKIHNEGIELSFSSYNSFIENNVSENNLGIGVWTGSNCNLFSRNIIHDNNIGISIFSNKNVILNNDFSNYYEDVSISGMHNKVLDNVFDHWGIMVWEGMHIIKNNTIAEKPIYCYLNQSGIIVPGDASQVILINCTNFLVKNITFCNAECSVQLLYSSHNSITENQMKNCTYSGLYIYKSNNNTISENIISKASFGMDIANSKGNLITNNIFSSNIFEGVIVSESSKNEIIENQILMNKKGISIRSRSNYNRVSKNNISYNQGSAIYIEYSSFNIISENNIFSNGIGVKIEWASSMNLIKNNNFIRNEKDAYFFFAYFNFWIRNYWYRWKIPFPKPIFGLQGIVPSFWGIPWLNFDWMPRMFPYGGRE